MTFENREVLAARGCPVGTLCAELRKDAGPLADQAARVFGDLLGWLEAQFRQLGKGKDSRDLAAHLLSAIEGASLLALTFHDSQYVARESAHLKQWLRTI
jgi:TetR/AcrR family transcriptional repressor of nem operon